MIQCLFGKAKIYVLYNRCKNSSITPVIMNGWRIIKYDVGMFKKRFECDSNIGSYHTSGTGVV